MKIHKTAYRALGLLALSYIPVALISCEDEVSKVGGGLASGEVQIAIDSLVWDGSEQYIHRGENSMLVKCPKIEYATEYEKIIDSRSTTNLLGRISVPEYGDLYCSFVTRLMCAKTLAIPDSIPVEQIDSMKLILSVPRGQLTGDSLAPQQLRVYRLTKSLPTDIDNTFKPAGYYDPQSPLGSKTYTITALGMSDSIYTKLNNINIDIPMSKQMAQDTYNAYKKSPETFGWPETFEQYFHGIYVEPSFGRGCVANVTAIKFLIYYNYKEQVTVTKDDKTTQEWKTKVGAVGVFENSPIVLSSNNITYNPSTYIQDMAAAGVPIITAPGGYRVKFTFPGRELVDIYNKNNSKLSVVSGLSFNIPVDEIENEYGITPPPYLLMVRTSKLEEFLANNKLPDNKDSFYATYSKANKRYIFTSMRQYILDLIDKDKNGGLKDEDLEFTMIPANLTIESSSSGSSTSVTYTVTKCTPYISTPAMCRLQLDKAETVFTYSIQQMK